MKYHIIFSDSIRGNLEIRTYDKKSNAQQAWQELRASGIACKLFYGEEVIDSQKVEDTPEVSEYPYRVEYTENLGKCSKGFSDYYQAVEYACDLYLKGIEPSGFFYQDLDISDGAYLLKHRDEKGLWDNPPHLEKKIAQVLRRKQEKMNDPILSDDYDAKSYEVEDGQ